MKVLARIAFLSLVLSCSFIFVFPALAEEAGKYGQWQSADDRLEKMISELDRIIEEGTRAKAAHPDFLKDLRTTIDQYRIPKKIVFFTDNFSDSNFTQNPTWTVSQGEYSIDRYGSLYSSIAIRKPTPQEEAAPEQGGDKNLRILLGVLTELSKDEKGQPTQADTPSGQAIIYSKASIPNTFNLHYSFRSAANWGSISIGVFQGDDPKTGYHIVYQASPGDVRPIQLIKYRYGKPYIIDEVRENTPNLDDGTDHIFLFSRTAAGDMIVSVDGKELLRTSDLSYKDDFSGVTIINSGGSYSYDNIEFSIEQ